MQMEKIRVPFTPTTGQPKMTNPFTVTIPRGTGPFTGARRGINVNPFVAAVKGWESYMMSEGDSMSMVESTVDLTDDGATTAEADGLESALRTNVEGLIENFVPSNNVEPGDMRSVSGVKDEVEMFESRHDPDPDPRNTKVVDEDLRSIDVLLVNNVPDYSISVPEVSLPGPSITCNEENESDDHEDPESDSSSSSSDQDLNEILRTWNPMEAHYSSLLNFGIADRYEEAALAIGGTAVQTNYKSIRDVPCPYNDGVTGSCWKGIFCVRAHPILTDGKSDLPTETRLIHMIHQLPKKSVPTYNAIFEGVVTHVLSPLEFYVVPVLDFDCSCKFELVLEYQAESAGHVPSLCTLQKEIASFMFIAKRKFHLDRYLAGQLVACIINTKGPDGRLRQTWERGFVTVEADFGVLSEVVDAPTVHVQLLDSGEKTYFNFQDVYSLPLQFTLIPPLARKCQLLNVRPVASHFSTECVKYFSRQVIGKVLKVEILQTVPHAELENTVVFEPVPYGIELRQTLENRLVSLPISQNLVDNGYGIPVEPFPLRPHALKVCPGNAQLSASHVRSPATGRMSSQLLELGLLGRYAPQLPQLLMERETLRSIKIMSFAMGKDLSEWSKVFFKFGLPMAVRALPLGNVLDLEHQLEDRVIHSDSINDVEFSVSLCGSAAESVCQAPSIYADLSDSARDHDDDTRLELVLDDEPTFCGGAKTV